MEERIGAVTNDSKINEHERMLSEICDILDETSTADIEILRRIEKAEYEITTLRMGLENIWNSVARLDLGMSEFRLLAEYRMSDLAGRLVILEPKPAKKKTKPKKKKKSTARNKITK